MMQVRICSLTNARGRKKDVCCHYQTFTTKCILCLRGVSESRLSHLNENLNDKAGSPLVSASDDVQGNSCLNFLMIFLFLT